MPGRQRQTRAATTDALRDRKPMQGITHV